MWIQHRLCSFGLFHQNPWHILRHDIIVPYRSCPVIHVQKWSHRGGKTHHHKVVQRWQTPKKYPLVLSPSFPPAFNTILWDSQARLQRANYTELPLQKIAWQSRARTSFHQLAGTCSKDLLRLLLQVFSTHTHKPSPSAAAAQAFRSHKLQPFIIKLVSF